MWGPPKAEPSASSLSQASLCLVSINQSIAHFAALGVLPPQWRHDSLYLPLSPVLGQQFVLRPQLCDGSKKNCWCLVCSTSFSFLWRQEWALPNSSCIYLARNQYGLLIVINIIRRKLIWHIYFQFFLLPVNFHVFFWFT